MKLAPLVLPVILAAGAADAAERHKAALPALGPQELTIQSDPEGAWALVVPDEQGQKAFGCNTPCKLRVPQGMRFRVQVTKDGYEGAGAPPLVRWVEKQGAWWQGNMGYVLEPNSVVFKLVPVAR